MGIIFGQMEIDMKENSRMITSNNKKNLNFLKKFLVFFIFILFSLLNSPHLLIFYFIK
jgi:hypothetical protein